MFIVECKGLSHSYASQKALNNIDLSVIKGELLGVIGPDGAGKTTLFRIIASLLTFDSGSVQVLGYNPSNQYREIRERLGYMPGRFSLYHDLTVEENLQFYSSVFESDLESNYHLIGDIFKQLEPFRKRRAGKLSGGMKQKLALSCALIHKPQLLILDEPTTGVDVVSRIEFWNVLKRLKDSGMTILVSTPYMDEARQCDRIALMQNGSILKLDTPEGISDSYSGGLFAIRNADRFNLKDVLLDSGLVSDAYLFGQRIHFSASEEVLSELKEVLIKSGFDDFEIEKMNPSIEDCFIQLIGRQDD